MNKPKEKTYPSHMLSDELHKLGHETKLMWEIEGPKNTSIAWISCYLLKGSIVLVHTFHEGCGWQAFTADRTNRVLDTIADVCERCDLPRPATTATA